MEEKGFESVRPNKDEDSVGDSAIHALIGLMAANKTTAEVILAKYFVTGENIFTRQTEQDLIEPVPTREQGFLEDLKDKQELVVRLGSELIQMEDGEERKMKYENALIANSELSGAINRAKKAGL